jgi:hypothetical protein
MVLSELPNLLLLPTSCKEQLLFYDTLKYRYNFVFVTTLNKIYHVYLFIIKIDLLFEKIVLLLIYK